MQNGILKEIFMKAIEMSDVLNAASKNIIIQNSWKQAKKLLIPTLAKIKNTLKNLSAFNYIANLKQNPLMYFVH